jgi:hypothetical protein
VNSTRPKYTNWPEDKSDILQVVLGTGLLANNDVGDETFALGHEVFKERNGGKLSISKQILHGSN